MAEAEALRAKLEREKQELRDFLEQGKYFLRFHIPLRREIIKSLF